MPEYNVVVVAEGDTIDLTAETSKVEKREGVTSYFAPFTDGAKKTILYPGNVACMQTVFCSFLAMMFAAAGARKATLQGKKWPLDLLPK